jgi:ABC-2 type transport system permease protein
MNNLWLVIKREYLTRVTNKSFILLTILTPLAIALFIVGAGYLGAKSMDVENKILVKDESGIFEQSNQNKGNITYSFSSSDLEQLKSSYDQDGYDILIHIPVFEDISSKKHEASYYSKKKPGLATLESVEGRIARVFRDYKIEQSQIDREVYDSFRTDINLENGAIQTDVNGKKSGEAGKLSIIIGTVLGYIMGFLMYMVIFIYGGMVMRSVMEEKINRIVEIIISSVKPTQLMLGKVIGVGMVALTQLGIWMILIPVVISVCTLLIPGFEPSQMEGGAGMQNIPASDINNFNLPQIIEEFKALNWWLILPSFVMFFLGGYFAYSALFAAIGSTIDEDMGQAQQFMIPIVIPVVFAFIIMQTMMGNPNGPIAVFGSMFPLFSPIVMPARLAFDPPVWQVLVSILLLILTVVFFSWLAGRIYRVGILMYGKKVTFKEIGKWLFYKF